MSINTENQEHPETTNTTEHSTVMAGSMDDFTTFIETIYDKSCMSVCDPSGKILTKKEALAHFTQLRDDETKTHKYTFKELKKLEKTHKVTFPYMKNVVDYNTPQCCKGIRKSNGLYVPCGTHVKSGNYCKVCAKQPNQDTEFVRRMSTPLGKFDKKENGMATLLAKQKSKDIKNKDEIQVWVSDVIEKRLSMLDITCDDLGEYHTEIAWESVNLTGKKGRPRKKEKPIVCNVGINVHHEDIIAHMVDEASSCEEEEEEHNDETKVGDDTNENEEEEESEVQVVKIHDNDGKMYYLDEETGDVYHPETEELVGTYEKKSKKITHFLKTSS